VVGSPKEIVEELIAWVEQIDVDRFDLAYAVMPGTFVDFVDLVVPELQRRGRCAQIPESGNAGSSPHLYAALGIRGHTYCPCTPVSMKFRG
jgi:hypothetical protein